MHILSFPLLLILLLFILLLLQRIYLKQCLLHVRYDDQQYALPMALYSWYSYSIGTTLRPSEYPKSPKSF